MYIMTKWIFGRQEIVVRQSNDPDLARDLAFALECGWMVDYYVHGR
jgi:hypothetical protein